jgi:hypothetical protein
MPDVTAIQRKDFASDLDEIAREGARRMLAEALEAEVADYIARNQERDEQGRAQVVRNGKARPRKVTLGSGTIEVRAPLHLIDEGSDNAVRCSRRGCPEDTRADEGRGEANRSGVSRRPHTPVRIGKSRRNPPEFLVGRQGGANEAC